MKKHPLAKCVEETQRSKRKGTVLHATFQSMSDTQWNSLVKGFSWEKVLDPTCEHCNGIKTRIEKGAHALVFHRMDSKPSLIVPTDDGQFELVTATP